LAARAKGRRSSSERRILSKAGQNFVRSGANIPEAQRAIARMRPAERELFARGYASNLADAVERSGDNRNVLNAAFFNNGAARSEPCSLSALIARAGLRHCFELRRSLILGEKRFPVIPRQRASFLRWV
jgi:hypothetical protein